MQTSVLAEFQVPSSTALPWSTPPPGPRLLPLFWGDNPHDATVNGVEILGIFLFSSAALLYARVLVRIGRPSLAGTSPVNTGMRMRRLLVICSLTANMARCLSLSAELASQEGVQLPFLKRLEPVQLPWVWDLVVLLPPFLFLSAFSVVVLFWAQLHYTTTIVPLPLLDCLFICVNIACYLLVTAIALCTFLLQAYSHLRIYMICIIGFLNVVVALSFFYYGLMVVLELRDASRKKSPGKRLAERVVALLAVCPLVLLLRGGCYLAWGMSLGQQSQLADLALCLSSEWLPSVAALVVLNPLQHSSPRSPTDALNDSTDSEPLLQDAHPTPRQAVASVPGLTWKQLYPQPAPP